MSSLSERSPVPRHVFAGLAVAAALTLTATGTVAATPARGPAVVADVTLPAAALKRLQPSIADDRGVRFGGAGSGLFPAGRAGEFWLVTDRGPNGQPTVDGEKRRTFPVPDFAPAIVRVALGRGTATIKQYIPITGASGRPVTGLSNQAGHDETPYTWDGRTALPYNPSGLDVEDLVRTRDGDFWLVDEYGPSLVRVSRDGRVLERHVPVGLGLTGADYPVKETLPAILASRQQNRGFEGLAISADQRTLYLAVQSPLANPDKKTAKKSRIGRILTFDLHRRKVTGEYPYQFEDVTTFDPKVNGDQSEMKISGLAYAGPGRLLVDERTDNVARVYSIDLTRAANLLGGPYDDPKTSPSLEEGTGAGLRLPAKSLVLEPNALVPSLPGKIEGLAVLDPHTIALANDNDFGLGDFGSDGRLVDSGVPNRLVVVRLPRPLGAR
ncbi:esterase-like activity of phytase family protein [Microbispora cellulosiformans]|uniref:Esterase-like activity of phytase family protein n=1 Tax=Microbispora cellulosiformans TaxID=2614688 RepID=A0A5J5K7A4_9ACTN|nr:esterase-like activity of phytase family protein [Microbispora cellulosiformans]